MLVLLLNALPTLTFPVLGFYSLFFVLILLFSCLNVSFSKTNQDSMFANVTLQNKFWKEKRELHIVICILISFLQRLVLYTQLESFKIKLRYFQSTFCFPYVDTCCKYPTIFSLRVQVSSSLFVLTLRLHLKPVSTQEFWLG